MRPRPTWNEERRCHAQGLTLVAGTDEVGCGCWAGPVYAGAVMLPLGIRIKNIRDSKALTPEQRQIAAAHIQQQAIAWSIGIATVEEVDQLNVRRASGLAMQRAIQGLSVTPDAVLSDAFRVPGISMYGKNIIRGDAKVISIAAASIIAKVARDAYMEEMDTTYPGYAFAAHKGYGTAKHQTALKRLGICAIHRKTYKPIARYL